MTFSPDGKLFVSSRDQVLALDDDGKILRGVDVRGALGLAWWKGQVVVAGLDGINIPNFVVVTPWDTRRQHGVRPARALPHGRDVAIWHRGV